ncbi:MAG: AbrB/MazE/SpoVT family DNA-binding domain-containing protein [Cyanobium sp.]
MGAITITSKGQVTLGQEFLRHLGVTPGDRIELITLPGGRIELRAVRATSLHRWLHRQTCRPQHQKRLAGGDAGSGRRHRHGQKPV